MFPSSKRKAALITVMALAATVAVLVFGAVAVVAIGAGAIVWWAAGTVYDALRPARPRE